MSCVGQGGIPRKKPPGSSSSYERVKEAQIEGRKGMKEVRRVGLAFQNWCIKMGWNSSHQVFAYDSVASFICAHVIKNKGSTRSVGNILSAN